tara:strand:- start:19562 stop:20671 length:1110 start_codon:yes stop_codon:yes gene_type:complete
MKLLTKLSLLIFLAFLLSCSKKVENTNSTNKLVINENFEKFLFAKIPNWVADPHTNTGPYTESGEFYQQLKIYPPDASRNSIPLGENNWLTAEIYTRTEQPILIDYLDIVKDPINPNNKVLKLSTPDHTDAVILRPTNALPAKYQLSFKIGFINYGDDSILNGYNDGNEMAGPWREGSSVGHNGFYWFALMDQLPTPHNNIWSHHHRKFVIDSWNRKNNHNTVNVIALDGRSETHTAFGKKFISYVNRDWQKVSDTPIDNYLPNEWYTITFTRTSIFYKFSITGKFKNAGNTTYKNQIDLRKNCVFHYNQTPEELDTTCVDNQEQTFLEKKFTSWPINSAYPDYFMIGEPHINYYEGNVLIDDIKLKTL